MTIKEFREWLSQFDEDALVEVTNGDDYEFFHPDDVRLHQYNDCENSWCGKKVLTLGS